MVGILETTWSTCGDMPYYIYYCELRLQKCVKHCFTTNKKYILTKLTGWINDMCSINLLKDPKLRMKYKKMEEDVYTLEMVLLGRVKCVLYRSNYPKASVSHSLALSLVSEDVNTPTLHFVPNIRMSG